jgi:hypothetical protein
MTNYLELIHCSQQLQLMRDAYLADAAYQETKTLAKKEKILLYLVTKKQCSLSLSLSLCQPKYNPMQKPHSSEITEPAAMTTSNATGTIL